MEIPGLEEFVEEVDEILQDLEQGILQLEAQPRKKSKTTIMLVFR